MSSASLWDDEACLDIVLGGLLRVFMKGCSGQGTPSLVPAYCIVLTMDAFSVSAVGERGYSCQLLSSHPVYRLYTRYTCLYELLIW